LKTGNPNFPGERPNLPEVYSMPIVETFAISLLANLITLCVSILRESENKKLEKKEKEKLQKLGKRVREIKESRTILEDAGTLFNKALRNAQFDVPANVIEGISNDPEIPGIFRNWIFTVETKKQQEIQESLNKRFCKILSFKPEKAGVKKEQVQGIVEKILGHFHRVILSDPEVSSMRKDLAHGKILQKLDSLDKKVEDIPRKTREEIIDYLSPPERKTFIHNIPFPPNPDFKGRTKEMEYLFHRLLEKGENLAITPLGLSGLGGLGKTQLAIEFCHKYLHPHFPGGVFWVLATTEKTLEDQILELASLIGRDSRSFETREDCITWVRHRLGEGENCLLVLDNVTRDSEYRKFLPFGKNCGVLITTRLSHVPYTNKLPLKELDEASGYQLLICKRKPEGSEEEKAGKDIAKLLGYFPLALEIAAHYLGFRRMVTFGTYLENIRNKGGLSHIEQTRKHLEKTFQKSFTNHDVSVYATFQQSLELLKGEREALDILRLSALFDCNAAISSELLENAFLRFDKKQGDAKEKVFVEALGKCTDISLLSLIDPEETRGEEKEKNLRIRLHPLVAEFLLMDISEQEKTGYVKTFLRTYTLYLNIEQEERSRRFRELLSEVPHFRKSILLFKDFPGIGWELKRDFYYYLANFYLTKQDLSEALEIFNTTEKIVIENDPDDEKGLSSIYNQKGLVLQDQGDLEGALSYLNRALSIDEKEFGKNHPNVARDVNNIGLVLKDQGDLEGALSNLKRALSIDEKTFGKDHPNVAIRVNNIAMVLKDQGDLEGAVTYLNRALSIDEKTFGKDHPNVARDVNNIGMVLQDQGDLEGAFSYLNRALSIDEKTFGKDHPKVAIDVNNIATVLKDQGDLEGARKYLERAFEIFLKTYGKDNPSTKIVLGNLVSLKTENNEK